MAKPSANESFRDSLSTVDKRGKRIWIYPKKPSGRWTKYRTWVAWVLLVFLFGAPFVKINGEQLILINVIERKFVFFGHIFWPQDLYLFMLAMLTGIVFIALFTVVFGRLFCGWVCPQTIFMEMVFRRIEYLIEGDYKQQKWLDKQPWNFEKIWKKSLKHAVFILISFFIGNTFLAYIIGSDALFEIITSPVTEHLAGFTGMVVFSGLFYGVFAFMREQVCTTVCPYGRLQGVLLDRDSLVVAYDYKRGEGQTGRAKFRKNEDRKALGKGDCIDCHQCVDVCPTGIDIRNGTQLECINCTACIDACNAMMNAVGLPENLIGYKSEASIAEGRKFKLTPRAWAYTGFLVILSGALLTLLLTRAPIQTTLLRVPGTLYQQHDNGEVSNLYNYKLINKTNRELRVKFELDPPDAGRTEVVGGEVPVLKPAGMVQGTMFIYTSPENLTGLKTKMNVAVYANGEKMDEERTYFMGPVN
ncbi:MAG: cytochrome c oxidase accessory protein CcoG [Salibacteraceae bacterium]